MMRVKQLIPDAPSPEEFIAQMTAYDEVEDFSKPQDIVGSEFNTGYISPQGDFYGCPDVAHRQLAEKLVEVGSVRSDLKDEQQALDEAGWIKLSMGRIWSAKDHITQHQFDTIFDYMMSREKREIDFNRQMTSLAKLGDFVA